MSGSSVKTDTPTIVGVIGHPIKHSLSHLMHNEAFRLGKINSTYLSFDVIASNLKDALKGMKALGIRGFNVTLPFKETIIQYLDEVSEEASVVGAVNTIVNENGKLFGYNTDTNGVFETLAPHKDKISEQTISVIGAGGASRSVIFTLIRKFKPAKINIINRTKQRAETLADYFNSKMNFEELVPYELVPPDLISIFQESSMIINATASGMFPKIEDSPLETGEVFNEGQIVFDVIYNPLKTKFLDIAENQGATIINGLKMFVEQGALSYELWTGEKMPKAKVYLLLEETLQRQREESEKRE